MPAIPRPAAAGAGEEPVPAPVPDPLVRAARGGDRVAFERLHAVHAPMVHAVLLAHAPRTEVDDLAQDVFLQAWERLPTLRDPEAFAPWLAAIARNRGRDARRRGRATVSLAEVAARPAPPGIEAREALDALRSLPEAYRETLALRFVAGLTGPEIAARVGMTPGSVRVNLHRGLGLLKERLGWAKETP